MLFKRKKVDGFDWHEYVRTTIQLRRGQRRAKLEAIGGAVVGRSRFLTGWIFTGIGRSVCASWVAMVSLWRRTIAQPAAAFPILLVGAMMVFSGSYRWFQVARDLQAIVPLALGSILLALVAPLALGWLRLSALKPWPPMPARLVQAALAATAVCVVVLGLGWFAWGRLAPSGALGEAEAAASSSAAPSGVIEGRAIALSGEMIRLQGQLLHLSGIEAPDQQQTCASADSQPWRCGEAALAALQRLAHSKKFRCLTRGLPDAAGRIEANCTVDGHDVAGALVKDGHVFSTASYFGGYAALEAEARRAGLGLWSGDADRPAEYRAKLWDAAKAGAPGGCPIKGKISGRRKTYLMPWNARYATTQVHPARGEQWFCDEDEAKAAGFRPAPVTKGASR